MTILSFRQINLGNNLIIAVILLVTLLSFANTPSFDFTNFDEGRYVVLNERVRDFSPAGIIAIFSSMDLNLYTPLTTLSFAADYALWGLNPAGYHAGNLLLHLLNTWLVFWFCMRISRNIMAAGIAACLFGVHPIHVESVAWIAERKDLLFTAFALGSLLLYDNYYRLNPGKKSYLAASIFMFLCSILSKPQAVALPVVLLLMDYFHDQPLNFRQRLTRIWPFVVLALLFCGMTLYFSIITYDPGDFIYAYTSVYAWWNRPFLAAYGVCFYLVKLFWPFNLLAWYACPDEIKGLLPPVYYLSMLGMAGIFYLIWRLWEREKYLVFGLIFYLSMLLPVLQIVPFGHVVVAERYAYMSSIGIFLIVGQMVAGKVKEQPGFRYLWGMALVFIILGLALLTFERNKVWASSETLYSDIIAKNPHIALAYNNRGAARYHLGDYSGAGRDYDEAIRLDPKHVSTFYNRAILRGRTQDVAGAMSDYNVALALDSRHADAYYNRGLLRETQNDFAGALRDFTAALLINPEFDAAFVSRGTIRNKRGQYDQALADFRCAIRLNPTNSIAYNNRGVVRYQQRDYAGANQDYNEAIRFNPKYVNAFFNRGILRGQMQDVHGALCDYNAALALDPRHADSYYNRGLLLETKGDVPGALRDYTRAIFLKPDMDSALSARGTLSAERGQYDQALVDFKNALALNPTNAVVCYNMGKVYLAISNSAAAGLCFKNARNLGLRSSQ